MARGKNDRKGSGTIIRKFEIVEGGHHGGAWKVAYADFVTAMMAFFLLMWLLNATTEDQRKGLADYFSPNNLLSHASSGTGQPFGGHTAFDNGALVSDRGAVQVTDGKREVLAKPIDGDKNAVTDTNGFRPADAPEKSPREMDAVDLVSSRGISGGGQPTKATVPSAKPDADQMGVAGTGATNAGEIGPGDAQATVQRPAPQVGPAIGLAAASAGPPPGDAVILDGASPGAATKPTAAQLRAEKERLEKLAFEQAAQQIRDAVQGDPALKDLASQLAIDMTPEGLRIQIMDDVMRPMFATGSAEPDERARLLLQKVVPVLARLPQQISIAGHTDAVPYTGLGRSNWELSAERANATRRLLVDGGLPDTRFRSVTGNADRDPLVPNDPLAAANRRIAIVVLRDSVTAKP